MTHTCSAQIANLLRISPLPQWDAGMAPAGRWMRALVSGMLLTFTAMGAFATDAPAAPSPSAAPVTAPVDVPVTRGTIDLSGLRPSIRPQLDPNSSSAQGSTDQGTPAQPLPGQAAGPAPATAGAPPPPAPAGPRPRTVAEWAKFNAEEAARAKAGANAPVAVPGSQAAPTPKTAVTTPPTNPPHTHPVPAQTTPAPPAPVVPAAPAAHAAPAANAPALPHAPAAAPPQPPVKPAPVPPAPPPPAAKPARPPAAPAQAAGTKPGSPTVSAEDQKLQQLAERLLGAMAEVNEKQRKEAEAKKAGKAGAQPSTDTHPKEKPHADH